MISRHDIYIRARRSANRGIVFLIVSAILAPTSIILIILYADKIDRFFYNLVKALIK